MSNGDEENTNIEDILNQIKQFSKEENKPNIYEQIKPVPTK